MDGKRERMREIGLGYALEALTPGSSSACVGERRSEVCAGASRCSRRCVGPSVLSALEPAGGGATHASPLPIPLHCWR